MPHRLLFAYIYDHFPALSAWGMTVAAAAIGFAEDPVEGLKNFGVGSVGLAIVGVLYFAYLRYHKARAEARIIVADAAAKVAEAAAREAQAELTEAAARNAIRIAEAKAQAEWELIHGPSLQAKIDALQAKIKAFEARTVEIANETRAALSASPIPIDLPPVQPEPDTGVYPKMERK